MKKNTNQKDLMIKEILDNFQIPDFCFLGDYLSEIFADLVGKNQTNLKTLDKYMFSKYFEIYGIILDRIFKIFDHDNDGYLDRIEFILGMKVLYSQNTSFKSLAKFIFKIYDFDQDGKINKDDVKLILSHIYLSSNDKEFREIFENLEQFQNKLKNIIDISFGEKIDMDFNDFFYVTQNICSDIFIFILMFLLEKRPFSDETILVYILEKNNLQNLFELQMKYPKDQSTIIKSTILNIESIINNHYKNKFNINKLLIQKNNQFLDIDSIYNIIKGNIVFHEGIIFKLSKDVNDTINKVKQVFFRLVGKDLYYYKKTDLINHKGINNLSCTFAKEGEDLLINGVKYFSIVINYYKKEKIYYFDIKENRNIWLEKLREAIGQKNIIDKYEFSKKILGKGSFSYVICGTNKITNQNVAIKIINKKNLDDNELELIMNELYIMKICKSPYIVKLYDIYETNNNIYIVMEHCGNGNLTSYFDDDYYKLDENHVKYIIYELLLAVNFIHSLGIIHRDIKPTNILFFDKSKINIRLTDFGLSTILGPNEKSTCACGTLVFAAPELLKKKPYEKSVDLWNVGIVTFYLLCGYLPFDDKNSDKILERTINEPTPFKESIWKNISVEAKDFVSGLLEKNPENRFNIKQILKHPWIKSLDKSKEI